jgi:outer membrane protein TolC
MDDLASVNVQLERYRLGSITINDLGIAQDQLNLTEEQAVTARFDYLRAKAQIEATIGRPL